MSRQVVVSGIPSAAGAFTDSTCRSTAALRGAGLVQSLESAGLSVTDRPDLAKDLEKMMVQDAKQFGLSKLPERR